MNNRYLIDTGAEVSVFPATRIERKRTNTNWSPKMQHCQRHGLNIVKTLQDYTIIKLY